MADEDVVNECPECEPIPECKKGAPEWMATFSDLVTLLLTFFVLLYAMSKTDESKFESVAGSIRKAFAGNALKIGETIQLGKSPDDAPTMIESQEPVEPFPIDLLTTEGFLDKQEINRESDEVLAEMRKTIQSYDLAESVDFYQMKEGIKIRVKDKIIFKPNSTEMANTSFQNVFQRVVKLLRENKWTVFVEGYADKNERDAYNLSSQRTMVVMKAITDRGVSADRVTPVFYGSSRAVENDFNSKVELILRKRDLRTPGKRVPSR